jgi:transcription elongation factor GreA
MNEDPYYLTPEGAEKLSQELDELRGPRRDDLAKRLRFAIQQGDLSENADYIAAKEEQAFLEGRIQELEIVLRDTIILDKAVPSDHVEIGNSVEILIDGREPEIYQLVGVKEANPRQSKISYKSPIGKALLGKVVGDIAIAQTPAGEIHLKILEIK